MWNIRVYKEIGILGGIRGEALSLLCTKATGGGTIAFTIKHLKVCEGTKVGSKRNVPCKLQVGVAGDGIKANFESRHCLQFSVVDAGGRTLQISTPHIDDFANINLPFL